MTVILLPGTLGSFSALTSCSCSPYFCAVRPEPCSAAGAPTITKAAPATFLNEMLIVVSFQAKKHVGAPFTSREQKAFRQRFIYIC